MPKLSILISQYLMQKDTLMSIISKIRIGFNTSKCFKNAIGKYIMILDADDILELDACELAYNQIKENGNDLVINNF